MKFEYYEYFFTLIRIFWGQTFHFNLQVPVMKPPKIFFLWKLDWKSDALINTSIINESDLIHTATSSTVILRLWNSSLTN